jgi:uncharacterized membrane protein
VLTVIIVFFGILLFIWGLVWFLLWLVGVILAFQASGRRVNFPVLGSMAASYVPMIEGWAK